MTIGNRYKFNNADAYVEFKKYTRSENGKSWIKKMKEVGVSEINATIAMAKVFDDGFSSCKKITEIRQNAQN